MSITPSGKEQNLSKSSHDPDYWDEVDIEACLWKKEHEVILSRIADQSLCYYWLTNKSMKTYSFYNMLFTLPVILISTMSGTANFAQMQLNEEYRNTALMVTGAFTILGGVLHTVQQYSKISEKVEKFRHVTKEWLKLHHFLKFELSRRPAERISPGKLLREVLINFEKIVSQCPEIPEKIIKEFKESHEKNSGFSLISKPEICDFLESTSQYVYVQDINDRMTVGSSSSSTASSHEKQKVSYVPQFFNVLNKSDLNLLSLQEPSLSGEEEGGEKKIQTTDSTNQDTLNVMV